MFLLHVLLLGLVLLFNWFRLKGSLCPAFDVLSLREIQLSKPHGALGAWLILFAVNCVLYLIKFLVA